MTNIKRVLFFLFFAVFLPLTSYSKDILIGDLIPLKIKGMSQENVTRSLEEMSKEKDIKIEEIKPDENGNIVVKFRCYSLGENTLILGNKKLDLVIKSSLPKDETINDIYMDMTDGSNKDLYWGKIPYMGSIGVILALFGSVILLSCIRIKRKNKIIDPCKVFEDGMNDLPKNEWEYRISYLLRFLIDNTYKSNFLNGIYETTGKINTKDIKFISDLDDYKFSRHDKNAEKYKKGVKNRAFEIYERIKGDKKEDV